MIFRNIDALKVSAANRVLKVGDTISDIKEARNAGVTAVGIVEGSSEMGLTKAEWDALSEAEQYEKAMKVEARYREAGADHVIADIRGVLKLIGLQH